jgi:hypothetical protein
LDNKIENNWFSTQLENVFRQKRMDLIHNFIRFAYNEMQHKGWYNNRVELRKKYNILNYDEYDYSINKPEVTFSNMLLRYEGDLDKTLTDFFCREIKWRGWIDSYYYDMNTDIGLEVIRDNIHSYWYFTIILKDWIEKRMKNGTLVDELKSILDLHFCLK